MEKIVWILYCSQKGGHRYPAEALSSAFKNLEQYQLVAKVFNLLSFSPLSSFISEISRYGDLKFRSLWRAGYKNLERRNPLFIGIWQWLSALLFSLDGVKGKLLRKGGLPSLIISLQPEINVLASLFKGWFGCPFHTVIIDLALHGLWVNKEINHYYLFHDRLLSEAKILGVSEEKVTISGIPLRPDFASIRKKPISEVRRNLSLPEDLPTILLLAGLLGEMVKFEEIIKEISSLPIPIQLLIVCGKNEKAKRHLAQFNFKNPTYLYGEVSNMAEMMWASDLVISKPGSVTMSECLALGKPMIVLTPKAGSAQELRFANFLEEVGAGIWVKRIKELPAVIKEILSSPEAYSRMKENAERVGLLNLTASQTIAQSIRKTLGG
ncbi:MAG: glycosyltransferase [candidate division WOR-3 bacterium]